MVKSKPKRHRSSPDQTHDKNTKKMCQKKLTDFLEGNGGNDKSAPDENNLISHDHGSVCLMENRVACDLEPELVTDNDKTKEENQENIEDENDENDGRIDGTDDDTDDTDDTIQDEDEDEEEDEGEEDKEDEGVENEVVLEKANCSTNVSNETSDHLSIQSQENDTINAEGTVQIDRSKYKNQHTDQTRQDSHQKKKKSTKNNEQNRNIEEILQQILMRQENIQKSINNIESKLSMHENKQIQIEKRMKMMTDSHDTMVNTIKTLEDRLNQIERKQRERNLRLVGIREERGEDCYAILYDIMYHMNLNPNIETAHRTGRRQGHYPRHIIFRVSRIEDKYSILENQRQLFGKDFFFVEDLTKSDYEKKKALKPQMDKARREGKRWTFRNGNLYINEHETINQSRNRTRYQPTRFRNSSEKPQSTTANMMNTRQQYYSQKIDEDWRNKQRQQHHSNQNTLNNVIVEAEIHQVPRQFAERPVNDQPTDVHTHNLVACNVMEQQKAFPETIPEARHQAPSNYRQTPPSTTFWQQERLQNHSQQHNLSASISHSPPMHQPNTPASITMTSPIYNDRIIPQQIQ